MGEHDAKGPEQNEAAEFKKQMQPGERVQGLIQHAEHPLVPANKVKELTGIDAPATMAIEIGQGHERRRLLVVPVERDVQSEQGVAFAADLLLVDPDLIEFDERGPIGGFGLKGLKRNERVAFTGDNRRVDEKLDLTPGKDPSFMISVSRTGSLDIMVHPKSPAEIKLIFPDTTKKEAPVTPLATEVRDVQDTPEEPAMPPQTIEQRLGAVVEETEHAEGPKADEIFASPEAFMATLNKNKDDLGESTRVELLHIMADYEKKHNVQAVTEAWDSGLGDALNSELQPVAQSAFAETYQLDGMYNELETMLRSSLNYPDEMPRLLGGVKQMAQHIADVLGQTNQADIFLEKAATFMQHDDRRTKVHDALQMSLIVDDPAKVEELVAAHVPGERLDTMRQRLEHQLQKEPGYEKWQVRKQAMAVLAQQEPRLMTNQEHASQLRYFLERLHQSPEEALHEFVNLGRMGDLGNKIRSTLQRAQSIGAAA